MFGSWFWNGSTCPKCKSPHVDHWPDGNRCTDCGHTWSASAPNTACSGRADAKRVRHGVDCKCVQCLADAVVRRVARR